MLLFTSGILAAPISFIASIELLELPVTLTRSGSALRSGLSGCSGSGSGYTSGSGKGTISGSGTISDVNKYFNPLNHLDSFYYAFNKTKINTGL
ncbi:MAG: hypothetical protein C4589_01695 [Peptococcaceae bacterium]|nr:MAG: hypothetical protein C4589_01695 [Peptococcaceae bacterium]